MQKLIIVALVVLVGVMFGMGGSLAMLQGGTARVDLGGGIDRMALRQHVTVMQQTMLLNGMPRERLNSDQMRNYFNQQALEELRLARLAEAEGLLPKGETKRALLAEFLQQPVRGQPDRRMLDAIKELVGTQEEIDTDLLSEYLANQTAAQAYRNRYLPVPAVAPSSGRLLARLNSDQVLTQEVTLSTEPLAAAHREAVAADDQAIELAYDEIKLDRFRIPEAIDLQVLAVDADQIAAAVQVSEDAIQAYYDSHQDEFTKPVETDDEAEADEADEKQTEVQPLDAVRDQIRSDLAAEQATPLAEKLVQLLDQAIQDAGLTEAPETAALAEMASSVGLRADAHEQLTEDVTVTVFPGVRVEKPGYGTTLRLKLDQGKGAQLARIDDGTFYDKQPGFVSLPIQASDRAGLWFIVHLTERIAESYQPLEAVRDEVIDYLAARQAYPELLAKAQELQAAAMATGDLQAYCTESVLEPWQTELQSGSHGPLQEWQPPVPEWDGIPDESVVAIAVAGERRPIVLVDAGQKGDHYQIKLVQCDQYQTSEPNLAQLEQQAQAYRQQLGRFLFSLFNERMSQK